MTSMKWSVSVLAAVMVGFTSVGLAAPARGACRIRPRGQTPA